MTNYRNRNIVILLSLSFLITLSRGQARLSIPEAKTVFFESIESASIDPGETNFVCDNPSFDVESYVLPQKIEDVTVAAGLPSHMKHTFGTFMGLEAWIPSLGKFETPLVVRFTHLIDRINWNCAATYSSDWKDYMTRGDPLVRTPETLQTPTSDIIDLHSSDLRLQCMVHAWSTVVVDWIPEAAYDISSYITNYEFTDSAPGYDAEVSVCFDENGVPDDTCIETVAQLHCYKPSIMGAIVAQQVTEFGRRDGWNMYGNLNRDGTPCTANCRRYTDPTGYEAATIGEEASIRWQPLLETNGCGYESKQQHVTAHIGTLAVPSTMTREELNAYTAPDPNYSYKVEANKVINRMSRLNDMKKLRIEFFDNKLNVVMLLIDKIVKSGARFEQVLNYSVGLTGAEYDAVIIAWKEKVRHDLIRPTSWIQNNMAEAKIESWVRNTGTTSFKGKNFEAYVRVMPHSEYVSASACICTALKDYTDDWLVSNLNMTESISIEVPPYEPGSSKTEPGLVPEKTKRLKFHTMDNLKEHCGKSRLHGGMHFTASVDNANELCSGVGNNAAEIANSLWSGV